MYKSPIYPPVISLMDYFLAQSVPGNRIVTRHGVVTMGTGLVGLGRRGGG